MLYLTMRKRRCSTFELMFKNKVLDEKSKPTKERKILFPFKYSEKDSDTVIDIAGYREEFDRYDDNEDGFIDLQEFGQFLRAIGLNPTDDEVKELFDKMDNDNSGMIEFDEFIHILDHPMITMTKADIKSSMEKCFERLVSYQQEEKVGESDKFMLNVDVLRDTLTNRGKMRLTDEEVDLLINKVSPDSVETKVVDYRLIVELFVCDYEEVNIIGDNNNNDKCNGDHLDVPQD